MYHDHVDSDQSISVLGQTARLAVTAAAAATLAVGIAAEPLLSALDGAQLVP